MKLRQDRLDVFEHLTRWWIGDRAFSVVAPQAWNRLPTELKLLRSTDLFRRDLKTFLFHSVYGHHDTDWLWCALSLLVGAQYKCLSYSYRLSQMEWTLAGSKFSWENNVNLLHVTITLQCVVTCLLIGNVQLNVSELWHKPSVQNGDRHFTNHHSSSSWFHLCTRHRVIFIPSGTVQCKPSSCGIPRIFIYTDWINK